MSACNGIEKATAAPVVARSAARTSVRETVAVQADGSRRVDREEEFADGSRQLTSAVYPAGVPVPSVSDAVVAQQQQQQQSALTAGNSNVQYAPPAPPSVDRGPCGGHGCLIGGSVALTVGAVVFCCCVLPIVLIWVAIAAANNALDDYDDDYYYN